MLGREKMGIGGIRGEELGWRVDVVFVVAVVVDDDEDVVVIVGRLLRSASDTSSSLPFPILIPATARLIIPSHSMHIARPKPGITLRVHPAPVQRTRPSVLALSSGTTSLLPMGLLIPAHRDLDARKTFSAFAAEIQGRVAVGMLRGGRAGRRWYEDLRGCVHVRRKLEDGARMGAVGRSRELVFGVSLGVGGGKKVVSERKRSEGRRFGGRSLGWWRRNAVHSVQVQDMFRRDSGSESMLWM